MLAKEKTFFLSIIKDYIDGKKTEADESVDWKMIFDYSQSHQLVAIVYHQCKSFMSVDITDAFKSSTFSTIYSNRNRKKLTENILSILKESGISCFLIKGFEIANYYPNWEYRTMGDTDIVVDDLEKAHEILLNNNFQNISKNKEKEFQYCKLGIEYELHGRLVYDEAINLDSATAFLNSYRKHLFDGKLEDSFHFIFILNHLRKHFMNSGAGFRQFIDVAVLIKNNDKIDWTWTEEQLDRIGLLSFAKVVFYYIERWFGISAPIKPVSISEEVFETSTEYVFNNGVFGFGNEANKAYSASNIVRKSRHPKLTMVIIALKKIFPSYTAMTGSQNYSFLCGKPFLLPIAWIYRWGKTIKNGKINEGKKQISKSFVSKTYVAEREEMFKNWGC